MLILLPPSEGKAAPTTGAPLDLSSVSVPVLTAAREQVIEALVAFCATQPDQAMTQLAIPKTQPELVGLNAALRDSPTAPASQIYTGVVYDALSFDTLSTPAKARAHGHVMVTSSVFGLVGLADLIPSYRLSGGSSLPGLGGVQAHWRTHLGAGITDSVGDGLLVDLRSGTYAAFWKPTPIAERSATVRVLHERAGVRKVVSHFNKATKGRIVRALLEADLTPTSPGELAEALRSLGWAVEVGAPGKLGTQLDVVVTEL